MENEDTEKEIPGWKHRDTSSTFSRSISEIANECEHLIIAIDHHDFEGVELAARHSASIWLAAHAAHRRIVHCGEGTASIDGSSSLLEARTTLLDLFARAKAEIAVPRTHRLLDELREKLVTADAESAADSTHRS